jgi:cell fate regulator YaaT (PSP1 superfamily)
MADNKEIGCGRGHCEECPRREMGCSGHSAGMAGRGKLMCHNWLADVTTAKDCEYVEVQFKNTRKSFYTNPSGLDIAIGDTVVVEASPGHDVGQVTMVGPLVLLQMKRANLRSDFVPKKIFRHAREADMERFEEAKAREHSTMIESRKIAESLQLNMKIGDVEYQGDGGKAIFYYIADERVDFRKLIRILADTFKVRIEMKQIGARQEAGRIGGIGPCGRPLCCASWMTKFASVGTSAARFQDLSMNPQKLAGQCAKLKCCLNFEVDTYMEAQRKLPHKDINLETKDETLYYFKADILKREVTYTTAKGQAVNCVTIPASRAFEIIALNKRGIKVDSVVKEADERDAADKDYFDLAGQESLTRFDKSKRKKKKSNKAGGTAKGQEAKQPQPKGNKQQPQGAKQPQPQAKPKSQHQGGNKPPKQQGPKPQAKQPSNPNVNKKRKKPEQQ